MNHGRVGRFFLGGGNLNDLKISSERFQTYPKIMFKDYPASLGPEPRLVGGLNPLA